LTVRFFRNGNSILGLGRMPKIQNQPAKPLPTWRMAFQKQLDVLRAYGAVCGNQPRIVSNPEVAGVVGLKPDTVSMANSFFAAIGLLAKSEGGYTPAEELLAFARAYEWNAETAFQRVAPRIEASWFSEVLIPKLRFNPMPVQDALSALG